MYHRLGFCLVEASRVEDSTFMENTMQAHRRWAQLGGCQIKWKVRRRRTSTYAQSLSITKFLFEALAIFSSWTKLRTSTRFLHGLTYWNRFFEPLTSTTFPRTLIIFYLKLLLPKSEALVRSWLLFWGQSFPCYGKGKDNHKTQFDISFSNLSMQSYGVG